MLLDGCEALLHVRNGAKMMCTMNVMHSNSIWLPSQMRMVQQYCQYRACSGTQSCQGVCFLAASASYASHKGRDCCAHHSRRRVVQSSAQVQQHLPWPHRVVQHALPGHICLFLHAHILCLELAARLHWST